jgi:hypothetical protein
MLLSVLEVKRPDLGGAEADQRRRAEVLAEPQPRGVGGLHACEQTLRFLGCGRDVHAPPGQGKPQHGKQDLHASTAVGGH